MRCYTLTYADVDTTCSPQLADLANLTQPWIIDPELCKVDGSALLLGFKNTSYAPCELEELYREYCKLTDQPYPIPEMVFANSWMLFRVSLPVSY